MAKRRKKGPKEVKSLKHDEASRKNIPTAEQQSIAQRMDEMDPFEPVIYPRVDPLAEGQTRPRDPDLDPQIIWKGATLRLSPEEIAELTKTGKLEIGEARLVWRGKDEQDWSDLVVPTPPLYIQEKIHPKAIIEDLRRQTRERREEATDAPDLFSDFNGIDPDARTEFYQHDQNWQNRMILGDSLQVMASLAEREGLRGKIQCIYFDPPYGIKFNSNWQVSTRSRDVKDGKLDQITREPEQVKAFRDTWKDGIHSYLTYLRDRMTAMRDLLNDSGSIFVQIGDENIHRVRALMDEVFGEENYVNTIIFKKKSSTYITETVFDCIIWFSKHREQLKVRELFDQRAAPEAETKFNTLIFPPMQFVNVGRRSRDEIESLLEKGGRWARVNYPIVSQHPSETRSRDYLFRGEKKICGSNKQWRFGLEEGLPRVERAGRLFDGGGKSLGGVVFFDDWNFVGRSNIWDDMHGEKFPTYIVQTSVSAIQRCILMATDPGDLVLDPTCGSGTTAFVAEQWGRRWITLDTSRVALALARSRLMGARYPYYLLADSAGGREKEQDVSGNILPESSTHGDIRQGFVYERAPHITLKSVAHNAEIDVIWEGYQEKLEPMREALNAALGRTSPPSHKGDRPPAGQAAPAEAQTKSAAASANSDAAASDIEWQEWEIPREAGEDWPDAAKKAHGDWWAQRIARQGEIDKSIAQKADVEMLYDRPYEDKSKVRVAGPFTVESLSPHRVIPADEEELIHELAAAEGKAAPRRTDAPLHDFTQMVIDNLRSAGVHQAAREDRITFTSISGWPGNYIAAEGRFLEGAQASSYKGDRPPAGQAAPAEAQTKSAAASAGNEQRAAIFIGPEFGTVTRVDMTAAAREAVDSRFDMLIACAFSFGVHTSELTKLGPLPIIKARMNPDLHMSDELKNTGKGNLFVVFGEPDIKWDFDGDGNIVVEVLGVDVFDPKTGEVRASGKGDIAAWFIDTDYNEESFFVRHAYFLGANDPYKSLKTSLKAEIDQEAWETLYRDTSRPFARPQTGRFAVKAINHFGDEVMKVFGV